jgi:uncharacterized protein YjiS (DUF1127 family)
MIMATSMRVFQDALPHADDAPAQGGFFTRAFRRFAAAREARARAFAYVHLARMSDDRLLDLGYDPTEIRRIRSHADYPSSYWV